MFQMEESRLLLRTLNYRSKGRRSISRKKEGQIKVCYAKPNRFNPWWRITRQKIHMLLNIIDSYYVLCQWGNLNVPMKTKYMDCCRLAGLCFSMTMLGRIFNYLLYSSDLMPSDYHLFLYLKEWLTPQKFECDNELKYGILTVNKWFKILWTKK